MRPAGGWPTSAAPAFTDRRWEVAVSFPHLARGLVAEAARLGSRFTEYDGYVPEAGPELDPRRNPALVLSASRLEQLGACPLEYFFRHVLGLEPPEEFRIDSRPLAGARRPGARCCTGCFTNS